MHYFKSLSVLAIVISTLGHTVTSCDNATWEIVEKAYDACIAANMQELEEMSMSEKGKISLESCRKMDQLFECSALLTDCMTSHFAESEQKLFSLPIDPSATNNVLECEQLLLKEEETKHSVFKRSPGKSGGGGGRSSGAPGGAGVGQPIVPGASGNRTNEGNFSVAGLAVFGSSKMAKSMAEGLSEIYDEDDCWEHKLPEDKYNCICPEQCNIYILSSGSTNPQLKTTLLLFSTSLSFYINYFRN